MFFIIEWCYMGVMYEVYHTKSILEHLVVSSAGLRSHSIYINSSLLYSPCVANVV